MKKSDVQSVWNPPAKEPRQSGSERRLVRQFVVQERYQGLVETNDWFDDPDQPESSTATLEAAKQWMISDGKESPGHDTTYDHRIIERTEMVVHLPNAQGHPARTTESQ